LDIGQRKLSSALHLARDAFGERKFHGLSGRLSAKKFVYRHKGGMARLAHLLQEGREAPFDGPEVPPEGFAMKRFLLRFCFATAVTLLAVALGPSGYAQQSQGQQSSGSDEDRSSTAPRKADPAATTTQQQNEGQMPASGEATTEEAKTFSGKIVKENGQLMLKDPVTKVSYRFDDAAKAKQYAGKQVKVTGKLDLNTNTIHVESIELLM
jgi:hypothetical protein